MSPHVTEMRSRRAGTAARAVPAAESGNTGVDATPESTGASSSSSKMLATVTEQQAPLASRTVRGWCAAPRLGPRSRHHSIVPLVRDRDQFRRDGSLGRSSSRGSTEPTAASVELPAPDTNIPLSSVFVKEPPGTRAGDQHAVVRSKLSASACRGARFCTSQPTLQPVGCQKMSPSERERTSCKDRVNTV